MRPWSRGRQALGKHEYTGPLLGIDYGKRRIGVAVTDGLTITANELGFVLRDSDAQAAQIIAALAREQAVVGIVIGLPVHAASGDAGGNVRWVRAFLRELRPLLPGLSFYEVDERWSSQEAEQQLRDEGSWPAPPGKSMQDQRSSCCADSSTNATSGLSQHRLNCLPRTGAFCVGISSMWRCHTVVIPP